MTGTEPTTATMPKPRTYENRHPSLEMQDAERWAAVVARDKAADGKFYYSVATTGVYCRPSCAARRANRQNVLFHDSCTDAEAAGFRACKRCKPNEPALFEQHAGKIAEACRLIAEAEEAPKLDELARAAGLSTYHFHRIFKSVVGVTPKAYALAERRKRVRDALGKTPTVTQAIYDAGFNSNGRFYATSNDVLGMTPTDFRSGGANAEIRFAVAECTLGSILVASSGKGVCAIFLGDDPGTLVRELQDRFCQARLIGGDREFERVVAKVIGFVEQPAGGLDLPLDIRGTAFQHRVWQALRAIPVGETISYAQLAQRVGSPGAVRAVAGACAANKIAVAIPCHRVVRTDGSLSGYRWGVERKRLLIDNEARSRGAIKESSKD